MLRAHGGCLGLIAPQAFTKLAPYHLNPLKRCINGILRILRRRKTFPGKLLKRGSGRTKKRESKVETGVVQILGGFGGFGGFGWCWTQGPKGGSLSLNPKP